MKEARLVGLRSENGRLIPGKLVDERVCKDAPANRERACELCLAVESLVRVEKDYLVCEECKRQFWSGAPSGTRATNTAPKRK